MDDHDNSHSTYPLPVSEMSHILEVAICNQAAAPKGAKVMQNPCCADHKVLGHCKHRNENCSSVGQGTIRRCRLYPLSSALDAGGAEISKEKNESRSNPLKMLACFITARCLCSHEPVSYDHPLQHGQLSFIPATPPLWTTTTAFKLYQTPSA